MKTARFGNNQLGVGLLQGQLSPPHPMAKVRYSKVPRKCEDKRVEWKPRHSFISSQGLRLGYFPFTPRGPFLP